MNNHSLISASGHTHAKIALLGIVVSLVFVAVISASGISKPDAPSYGPVVKATTMTTVAGNGATVR